MSYLREWWPALVAAALLFLGLIPLVVTQLHWCDRQLVYMLDDTYIHMATAKNLALHGVWGITRHGFTASESSLLWPLLLAGGFKLAGIQESLPLVLNIVAAVGLVFVGQWVFRREGIAPPIALGGLCALLLLPSMPVMIMMGMEHVLQCLLALLFAHLCVRRIVAPASSPLWSLALSGALLAAVRYEGLFLVAVAVLLMLVTRNLRAAVVTGATSLVPLVAFGLISVSKGWQFLPNPLLAHGPIVDQGLSALLRSELGHAGQQLIQPGPLFMVVLLIATWVFVVRERQHRSRGALATMLALGAVLLHVTLAITWIHYGRYEAYLLVLTVYGVVLAVGTRELPTPADLLSLEGRYLRSPWIVVGAGLSVLSALVVALALYAYIVAPVASVNIRSQQYQMARFVQEYYPEGHIAVNDIGAVSFLSEARIFDLWGLGTNEVWKARESDVYDSRWIREAAQSAGVDVAIVYDDWFARYGGLPQEWIRVGRWTIHMNAVCGSDTVSFYAVDPAAESYVIGAMAEFSASLPPSVEESGRYIDSEGE